MKILRIPAEVEEYPIGTLVGSYQVTEPLLVCSIRPESPTRNWLLGVVSSGATHTPSNQLVLDGAGGGTSQSVERLTLIEVSTHTERRVFKHPMSLATPCCLLYRRGALQQMGEPLGEPWGD